MSPTRRGCRRRIQTVSPEPLRVGLIGYGLACAVFHAPLISAPPGLEVSSVVTSNPERQAQAARDLPGVRLLESADALWDGAAEHDRIVVAAPNRAHVPLALAAIQAGLPVVVDKPLAPTAVEGRRVVDAAAAADALLTVFHNRRWDGDMRTVVRLLAERAVGAVTRFASRLERRPPQGKTGARRERG